MRKKEINHEAINELVKLSKTGNTESIKELVTIYLPTIRLYSKRYTSNIELLEELIEEGILALLDGISNYNLDAAYNFDVYLKNFIHKRFKLFYKHNKEQFTFDYNALLTEQDTIEEQDNNDYDIKKQDNDLLYLANLIDQDIELDNNILLKEKIKAIHEALEELNLSEKDRTIIECLFGLNNKSKTITELAHEFNVSPQAIDSTRNAILKRLRNTNAIKHYLGEKTPDYKVVYVEIDKLIPRSEYIKQLKKEKKDE